MDRTPAPEGLAPELRLLKGLVTALTAVLILGLITIIALLVIRLPGALPTPPLPDALDWPEGAVPQAVTQGRDWVGVVTQDDRILIFDRRSGKLRQEVKITAPANDQQR